MPSPGGLVPSCPELTLLDNPCMTDAPLFALATHLLLPGPGRHIDRLRLECPAIQAGGLPLPFALPGEPVPCLACSARPSPSDAPPFAAWS